MEQFIGEPEMTDVHHGHDLSDRIWYLMEPHLPGCLELWCWGDVAQEGVFWIWCYGCLCTGVP